jgi:hypothetical protein
LLNCIDVLLSESFKEGIYFFTADKDSKVRRTVFIFSASKLKIGEGLSLVYGEQAAQFCDSGYPKLSKKQLAALWVQL